MRPGPRAQHAQSTVETLSAGCRSVELQDDVGSKCLRMLVLYPSSAPEQLERLGRFELAIDWVHEDRALASQLAHGRVAVVGHSLGGYAALAVAGGRSRSGPHETPGALEDVRIPILMRTGEKDESTPPWHAELVKRGAPDATRVDHRAVPNAGHYSFLSPFPEELKRPSFLPSQDPPGFDRRRFHDELNAEVTAFLRRTL